MLQKKTIGFAFTDMLDQKIDSKSLTPPRLLEAENVRRAKSGKLEKRYGCQTLGNRTNESAELLTDNDAVAVYRDELLQFNKQRVFSYSESAQSATNKGSWVSAISETADVLKNDYDQTYVDMALVSDIGVYAYSDTRGGVYLTIRDNKTGTLLVTDRLLHALGSNPRCLAFMGYLYVFYVVGNDLRAVQISPVATTISAEIIVTSSLNSVDLAYDVCAQDTYIVVVFNVNAATETRILSLNSSLSINSTTNIAEASPEAITCVRDSANRLFIAWITATKIRVTAYSVLLAQLFAPKDLDTVSGAVRITGYPLNETSDGARFFYEVSNADPKKTRVDTCAVTPTGFLYVTDILVRSCGLASRAWHLDWFESPDILNRGFVTVVHQSALQSTFFVMRNDGLIISKIKYGVAGGLMSINQVPNAPVRSEGVYQVPILTKNPVIALGDSSLLSFRGVSVAQIDFTDLRSFRVEELGGNGLVVGGVIGSYDAKSVVEHGFHLFPEDISLSESTGGTLTLLGTYSYKVVYMWTDNLGRLHRSAPSPSVSITLTGANNQVSLTIPTLRLTQKRGIQDRTDVVIAVFRTEDSQVNYYRSSDPVGLTYNAPNADTVTIIDFISDALLIGREPLYTTGDILENIAPPSGKVICIHKKRAFVLDEDGRIWFSKENTAGRPLEFSDQFIIEVDPIGGTPTALANLDDKLVIFKEDSIAYITGDGPDDRGLGGTYSSPEFISTKVGCSEPNSVIRTDEGIMFKSRRGIHLLGRDLQISFIGAQVEDYKDEISSAVALVDQSEVRFTSETGPCLVYNTEFKQWSVFTNYCAVDAVRWKGQFVYVRKLIGSPDLCVIEVPDYYLDISQTYSQKVSLSWAGFANLQGFQRIWRAHLIGDYKSKHKLKVSMAYDFSPVISDEYLWDAQQEMGIDQYGDLTYGDDVYGGIAGNFQVRIHIRRQKSQALRIIIEDVSQVAPYESFSLSGIAFELAIKKGNYKLPAGQTI
jgi:hypothetical protein